MTEEVDIGQFLEVEDGRWISRLVVFFPFLLNGISKRIKVGPRFQQKIGICPGGLVIHLGERSQQFGMKVRVGREVFHHTINYIHLWFGNLLMQNRDFLAHHIEVAEIFQGKATADKCPSGLRKSLLCTT